MRPLLFQRQENSEILSLDGSDRSNSTRPESERGKRQQQECGREEGKTRGMNTVARSTTKWRRSVRKLMREDYAGFVA